jgi:basic membrane protein A and related proteins
MSVSPQRFLASPLMRAFFATLLLLGLLASPAAPSPTPVKAADPTLYVGLIPDEGGLGDKGFNDLAYAGLQRAVSELGISGAVYNSAPGLGGDYYAYNLDACYFAGNELCISVGFASTAAVGHAAATYTNTIFTAIDTTFTSYPPNLRGVSFDEAPAAYLAGTLAGLMSQSHNAGDLGGMAIPVVENFTLPFQYGAQCAYKTTTVQLDYVGDFTDGTTAVTMANAMIANGADVIFTAAGAAGNSALLSSAQAGKWVIGVDNDQYASVFGSGSVSGANKILTSVTKPVDTAVYNTIADVLNSSFSSGEKTYTMFDLAPYHETNSLISADIKASLAKVKGYLQTGWINPNSAACVSQVVFLPSVKR